MGSGNRFRKAQLERMEAGHVTERITDLKTAGVAVKAETVETSKNDNKSDDIHNIIQEAAQVEIHETPPADNIATGSDQSKQTIIIEETPNSSNEPEPVLKATDIEIPVEKESVAKEPAPIKQQENSVNPHENNQSPETIVSTTSNVTATAEAGSQLSVKAPVSADIPVLQPTVPVNTIPVMEASPVDTPPVPITNEAVSVPTPDMVIPEPVQIAPQQIQPQYQQYTEPVVTKPSKNTRKSAPNIFAPKGEAKSMRKSLVLKPTSVKIAENYCAKNGGSFNELIQTLLDNFIDEYGL